MLYGTGLTTEDDMNKAQVGIASVWYEGNTCNMHLNDLAAKVKQGVVKPRARRHAVQHHRRQRRHLDGHRGDELLAAVARPHRRLDRNRDGRPVVRRQHRHPRLRQEHARLPDGDGPAQSPRLMVYGGTIKPGHAAARSSTSSRRSSATANSSPAKITDEEAQDIVRHSCPGAGRLRRHVHRQHHGLGHRSDGHVAALQLVDSRRRPESRTSAARRPPPSILKLLEKDIKPRDIMTRAAFENAMVVVMALGGSTNAVLHLIAMARPSACRSRSTTSRKVSDRVPFIADLKPSGKYVRKTCTTSAARRP
jgi:dihydroxy-acid dehydratase